jgi:hypothetical protein
MAIATLSDGDPAVGSYRVARDAGLEWVCSLTQTQLRQLCSVRHWLSACVETACSAASVAYGADFAPATFDDLMPDACGPALCQASQTLEAMGPSASAFMVEWAVTLFARAQLHLDTDLSAALESPLRQARRYLELVHGTPELSEMLEAMASGWTGSVEDLDLVAELIRG